MAPHRFAIVALLGLGLLALPACYSDKHVVHDGWDDMRKLSDKSSKMASAADPAEGPDKDHPDASAPGYAILLESFDGPHRHHQAHALVTQLTKEYDMTDLWTQDMGEQVQVLRGHYGDPDTDIAKEDLRQTQAVELSGAHPYAHAKLISLLTPIAPSAGGQGQSGVAVNVMDLRQHKGMFTLLIASYDGHDARQNAEKAAQALRASGEDAYFLHGEHSVVTVGLFTEADFPGGKYGPKVRALQAKYPYYLEDGRTLIDYVDGKRLGERKSFIIDVQ